MVKYLKYTNLDYLLEISEKSEEYIIKILKLFVIQVNENSTNFLTSLLEKDFNEISFIAHKAKSDVEVVGMFNLKIILQDLENLAKKKEDLEKINEYISIYIRDTQEAILELEKYFDLN